MNNEMNEHVSINGTDLDLYRFSEKQVDPHIIADGVISLKEVRHFVVINNGRGFPVAYVSLFDDDYICNYEPEEDVNNYEMLNCVNGGGTYMGRAYWDKDDKRKYIGWDYNHSCDYSNSPWSFQTDRSKRRWTVNEIIDECERAISQLQEMNEFPERFSEFVKKKKELWMIYHGYCEDGGYGDAIWEEYVVATVEATKDEIDEFVEKYDKPIVYDHPYDKLTAHHIRAEKVEIKEIRDVAPYGENDYFGQRAEEYELRKKYDETYGRNWNLTDRRDDIYEKYFKDLEEISKKYCKEENN